MTVFPNGSLAVAVGDGNLSVMRWFPVEGGNTFHLSDHYIRWQVAHASFQEAVWN
jgi:hypothetical protein